MGTNEGLLESKVMLVVYLQNLGAAKLRVFVSEAGLYSYLIHRLLTKRIFLPNLVLNLFHVFWLMNIFDYMFDILFI